MSNIYLQFTQINASIRGFYLKISIRIRSDIWFYRASSCYDVYIIVFDIVYFILSFSH